MTKLGCTTPFGLNKSEICTESNSSSKALKLYDLYLHKPDTVCPELCNFLEVSLRTQLSIKSNEDTSGTSYVKFSLKNTIKVTKSHFLYNGLTLMAEIGGYVGLFLGISVVHVNDMVRNVLERISGYKVEDDGTLC